MELFDSKEEKKKQEKVTRLIMELELLDMKDMQQTILLEMNVGTALKKEPTVPNKT